MIFMTSLHRVHAYHWKPSYKFNFVFQLRDSFLTDSTVMIGLSHLYDEENYFCFETQLENLNLQERLFFYFLSRELFI